MQKILPVVVIIVLGLIAYGNALNGTYIWDDDAYVTENRTLRTLKGLRRIWFEIGAVPQYYPLVHTTFWIEYHIWGLRPFGYHLDNVLLHALNAVLIWLLLRRLSVPGAWIAAAIFALHPVHVESVAWITERKNVLSTFFYLLSLLAYLRFSDKSEYKWRFYGLALILFVFALLSKTVTCSLPAVILLLLWWKRGRLDRSDAQPLMPFFAIGIGFGLLTAWIEKHHVGAIGEEWALSFVDRILIAGRALWFYAAKLFWPQKLVFIYPRWPIDSSAWWQYIFPLAAAAVIVALWFLRERLGKAPLVAVLFFAGTLLPALGFFNIYPMRYTFVADHFQYLASTGLIALFAFGASSLLERLGYRWKRAGFVMAGLVFITLGMLTWQQGKIYKDEETLWLDTITKNPEAWMAYNCLAVFYSNTGREEEAIPLFKKVIEINPDFAGAYNNLASMCYKTGKKEEAISFFNKAIESDPGNPKTYNNFAVFYRSIGKDEKAISLFKKAIEIYPDYTIAYNNLATVCYNTGKKEEAMALFKKALEIDPSFGEAHYKLSLAYYYKKEYNLAIRHCDEAIGLGFKVPHELLKLLEPFRK